MCFCYMWLFWSWPRLLINTSTCVFFPSPPTQVFLISLVYIKPPFPVWFCWFFVVLLWNKQFFVKFLSPLIFLLYSFCSVFLNWCLCFVSLFWGICLVACSVFSPVLLALCFHLPFVHLYIFYIPASFCFVSFGLVSVRAYPYSMLNISSKK